jgi:peptidylprolyl isomerase
MKRSMIVLVCSFVSAAFLLAQTESPQAPAAPPTTTQKTSATTAKTGTSKTTTKTSSTALWTTTGSGLKYQDVVVGKGPQPKPGDDILVNYTGRFTNGKIFDSSLAPGRTPFELHLGRGEVIKGWDEGLSTMHVGGKRKLLIPPDLAYGARGYPGVIPPNSTLTFDVELLRIK